MGINREVLNSLRTSQVGGLYRFQGGNSFEHLDIRSSNPLSECTGYVYFSKSTNHHRYFIAKRFKQIVNKLLAENSEFSLTRKNLWNDELYEQIVHIVSSHHNEIGDMHSIKFIYCKPFEELLNQNYVLNMDKKGYTNIPERVDRRKNGGGYGLPKEWLSLLEHLSVMRLDKSITTKHMLTYLEVLKSNSRPFAPKKDVIPFIKDQHYSVSLNEHIKDPFNKYSIIEDLEIIVEKGLCLPNSDLAKYPKDTINDIIMFYQYLREYILDELEQAYTNNYQR